MTRMRRALLVALMAVGAVLLPHAPSASAAERVITYSVTTQGAVHGDPGHFAAVATATLNDYRGWSLGGSLAFQQVPSGGDFTLILAAPAVVGGQPGCDAFYSCRVGRNVYVNDDRWRTATPSWPHGVPLYQQYVITHEVGHWLGLGHSNCGTPGRLAATMQQQSISLQGCRSNMWPLIAERAQVARNFGVGVGWSSIERRYQELGQERGPMGGPVTWESPTPGNRGWMQHYDRVDGASIYWSPSTGAHEVYGLIRTRWAQTGWELGPLGFPVTGELPTPDRWGRMSHFAGSGGGSIYWHPWTGAHEVYGAIRAHWGALGWELGPLSYPVTGELPTPDGRGRYNHFARPDGASIYWSPSTGAHEVYGAIRATWAQQGWEAGPLGYPVSGEYSVPGGRQSDFEHGSIRWDAGRNVIQVLPR
ncbi:DUF3152 domain-containing protein [Candidatus Blastococcus massiliensis]|uniref:DUF3152 domain-containing protein n=1 Tax=Candidatus Blastococcus massiliensis TaxID=1470358 RepID=UPI0004B6A343|nr:DUF3152 domain-containing protein [Candidatus Blastococcus massiliensis]